MHKLIDFICEELEDLERKAEKDGKLSMAEVQYADTLAHTKKNLLKSEEMMDDMEYSNIGSYAGGYSRHGNGMMYNGGGSYARGRGRNARRDSMGRYSSANESMISELHELMQDAPDEQTRMEFQRFIQKIEKM
jgi:hypothetical protein